MGMLSEDIFACLECGNNVVYEPFHTSGVEVCDYCKTKHLVKYQKPVIIKYDEKLSEHVNKTRLEVESWPKWKKDILNNLIKEST